MKKKTVAVPGSNKEPYMDAKPVAPAPQDERLEVTLRLRSRNPMPDAKDLLAASAAPLPQISQEEFESKYGASNKDFALVRKFAKDHNLQVVRESKARRSVMLAGTVADFNAAFSVDLKIYAHANGTYRGRIGTVCIPVDLDGIVEGVFGLDNRPVAQRHGKRARAAAAAGAPREFTPVELANLYNFPAGTDGTGQTIAIIELGGGYRPEDLTTYFTSLKLPVPAVIPVSVDGAANAPTTSGSDDAEVVLDIEVAAAVAPGARIVVYFAPNDATAKGFLDALTKAVHDTEFPPSVISISWGGPEDTTKAGKSFQTQFDQVLQAAAQLGVTVCVASGDDGAADMGPKGWDGKPHVDFPSSSPFALACGGTRVIESGGSIKSESIWNQKKADVSSDAGPNGSFGAGGGGISDAFPLPAYQKAANVPVSGQGFKGRGVPDVAAAADPATGYSILVDGDKFAEGGTSAVAPLWAGLVARLNQKLGRRVGFLNPQLYSLAPASGAFRDITAGNNRVSFKAFKNVGFDAGPGWDPCSGLGAADGARLADALAFAPPPAPPAPPAPKPVKKPVKKKPVKKKSA